MSTVDWIVLAATLLCIVCYGIWKSRGTHHIQSYLLANRELPWYHVGISVMATQASAITFLSAPGQAYTDGMRFIQFYFGLPLAMIVLCIAFVPRYKNLNVYTAYEYLGKRFDVKTRLFTSFLFLLQRGLSTGITVYATAIVLSTILEWNIVSTTLFIGLLVIVYTVYGGSKAVSYTHLLQMAIIFSGLIIAGIIIIRLLPEGVGFSEALSLSGKLNKMNTIDFKFDLNNKYNIWSGLIGGFFLQLSYFGTDQSQVGRYLTGSSIRESRMGLLFNGLLKIPMQFCILLIGILVFAFYQFHTPPLMFNKVNEKIVLGSQYAIPFQNLEKEFQEIHSQKKTESLLVLQSLRENQEPSLQKLVALDQSAQEVRDKAKKILQQSSPEADSNDSNYIFLDFVIHYLPAGIAGLLIAIIFLAAMGSTASALNSLASTTIIDFRNVLTKGTTADTSSLLHSRWATCAWGIFAMITALYSARLGNLIEAVNVLGSLFYGTILGIFLVAFFLKKTDGTSVFYAALISELIVVFLWVQEYAAFLWLNVAGCLLVLMISALIQALKLTPGLKTKS